MSSPILFSDLLGVEVFRPGTWHGVTYLDADMERIAENSNAMLPYFQSKLRLSPLKLGHAPESDVPQFIRDAAFGVATRYYTQVRDGIKRVYADFRNVPKVLAQAIDQFYRNRSVEKYLRFRHPETGEEYRDVISSVAFLGHIPPEVKGMLDDFAVLYQLPHPSGQSDLIPLSDCADLPLTFTQETPMATQDPTLDGKQAAQSAMPSSQPTENISRGAEPVSQTVTVTIPAQFTEEVNAAVSDAEQRAKTQAEKAFQEQLATERQTYQERLEALEAERAALAKQNEDITKQRFQDKIVSTLDALSLPPSFQTLGVERFMAGLDEHTPQQFAETGEQQSQYACFEALLHEVAKFWDASQQVLATEQAAADPTKPTTPLESWNQAVQTYMESHPNIPKGEAMKMVAEAQPDLVKEDA